MPVSVCDVSAPVDLSTLFRPKTREVTLFVARTRSNAVNTNLSNNLLGDKAGYGQLPPYHFRLGALYVPYLFIMISYGSGAVEIKIIVAYILIFQSGDIL